MNANNPVQISAPARQILSIASNSRCDADAHHRPDPGASFTSVEHRRMIDQLVADGLMEIVSEGNFAGHKEYNARLTNDGVAATDAMIYRSAACHHCLRVHY